MTYDSGGFEITVSNVILLFVNLVQCSFRQWPKHLAPALSICYPLWIMQRTLDLDINLLISDWQLW